MQTEINEVRTSVLDVIGSELSVIVKQLNFGQCTYLLSVYRLESLRVANDTSSFHQIFTYLENKPIQKDKAGIFPKSRLGGHVNVDTFHD